MSITLDKPIYKDWSLYEMVWACLFTLLVIIFGISSHDTLLDMVSGATGVINILLCAKGKYSNYYFGIIYVGTYAYIAWTQNLYATCFLFACYFLPMQFIGLYLWKKNQQKVQEGTENSGIVVAKMGKVELLTWSVLAILAIVILTLVLKKMHDPMPFFDASSSILSIIGMVWMTRRFFEQWYLWFISNSLTIVIWVVIFFHARDGHISQLIMNCAFFLNNFYGIYCWRKLIQKQEV